MSEEFIYGHTYVCTYIDFQLQIFYFSPKVIRHIYIVFANVSYRSDSHLPNLSIIGLVLINLLTIKYYPPQSFICNLQANNKPEQYLYFICCMDLMSAMQFGYFPAGSFETVLIFSTGIEPSVFVGYFATELISPAPFYFILTGWLNCPGGLKLLILPQPSEQLK